MSIKVIKKSTKFDIPASILDMLGIDNKMGIELATSIIIKI